MNRIGIAFACAAALVAGGAARAAQNAPDLVELAKNADLVVVGRVIHVATGEPDPELAKIGEKARTDIATIGIEEVLKGASELRQVQVGFPGFPKHGEPQFTLNQEGVWLLLKSDQKYYVAPKPDMVLAKDSLGAVRRAIRAAAGLSPKPPVVQDKGARLAELVRDLKNEDAAARKLAAFQLGELGEMSALAGLADLLKDESPSVRLTADIALRKITGHRAHADFYNGNADERVQGLAEWTQWVAAHKDDDREALLLKAADAARHPQPDLRYALAGLAQYDAPKLLPLFLDTLDSAVKTNDADLAVAAARYLGRTRNRAAVPKLAVMLKWGDAAARAAAVLAIGQVAGLDFGTGDAAVEKCTEWWETNKDQFR